MYLWKLVGNNASQDRMRSGAGDDLALIMRTAEDDLLDGSAFVARVYEVVLRVSVSDLGEVHVPTGREWHGRRNGHGGVYWEQRFRSGNHASRPPLSCDYPSVSASRATIYQFWLHISGHNSHKSDQN